jgi:hypothetical protein
MIENYNKRILVKKVNKRFFYIYKSGYEESVFSSIYDSLNSKLYIIELST